MTIHKNARLTPHGRAEVVREVVGLGRSARRVGSAREPNRPRVREDGQGGRVVVAVRPGLARGALTGAGAESCGSPDLRAVPRRGIPA